MIDAVNYRGLEMPPTGKLNPRQIAALAEWVKMGAPWPKEAPSSSASRRSDFTITDEDRHYWAYQPVGKPAIPKVSRPDWVANPIDAFVLARLEEKGLAPNPPADPRALVRRVFFDLIGLPPKPEEVDAFVADHSPKAYERLVDDLLSRKQYGERWGRHWLDVTRFAQTNGYERDGEKAEAWRYRDYVIAAFNDDKPYNRFVVEQLAGDELPDTTNDSIIATGFYRLGIWDDEPDSQKVAAWDEIDEMVRTTGSAFLGLTLGCARCHNHMFDPISQEDYYQFAAFFRNVEPFGVPKSATHLATNDDGIYTPLTTPQEYVPWRARKSELTRQLDRTEDKLKSLRKSVATRLKANRKDSRQPGKSKIDQNLTSAERAEKDRLTGEATRLQNELRNVPFATSPVGPRVRLASQGDASPHSRQRRNPGPQSRAAATDRPRWKEDRSDSRFVSKRLIAGRKRAALAGRVGRQTDARSAPPIGRMDRRQTEPADGPRDDESSLAGALRPRHRAIVGQFRPRRHSPHASGTPRLAGPRLHGRRLAHQADAQADRDVEHVSHVVGRGQSPRPGDRCRQRTISGGRISAGSTPRRSAIRCSPSAGA